MCGFVGIINRYGKNAELRLLEAMAQRIAHRGPDGEGYYLDDAVGLYHKRLAIIDLATGQQPMVADGTALVLNGEIYNFIELREELQSRGVQFTTRSDTEVLLRAYQTYGIAALQQLNGMFAFVLHDKKHQQLLAARDHFGIKPLYYFQGRDLILFASEIKALLAHPEVQASCDRDALNDYLTFQFVLGEKTLFAGIHKVKPGHYLLIDQMTLAVRQVQYWSPDFTVDTYHTEAYFTNELRTLLHDSIHLQLRSDVPVGTYLSGGLDSSLVTTIAAKSLPAGNLATFSGAFREGPEFSEMPYIEEMVRHTGAQSHCVYPSAQDFTDTITRLIYHLDEPVAGPGLFPQYMVSMLAKGKVKVVLGGQGGDEIFGGYARYVVAYLEQALKGAILQTTEEGEHIVSLKTILPNLQYIRNYLPMLKQFLSQGTFAPMDARYFHLINRMEGNTTLFTRDFLAGYRHEEIFARFQQLFNNPNTHSYYNKMTHFDLFGSLPALLQVEDRMSMAASIESRVPLLDRRIVDLIARMPPAMKFRGAEMKYILKKVIHDLLPARIFNRNDKMGFPVPFHLWAANEAKPFIQDCLLGKRARERGIFDPEEVRRISTSEKPFGRQLWGMLSLELWFQQFIDQTTGAVCI